MTRGKIESKPVAKGREQPSNWLEDQYFPNLSALAVAVISVATGSAGTVTVTTGEGVYFRAGDLVRIQASNEIFEVVSVAGDVLTVTRNLSGSGTTGAAIGDKLLIVSNAAAQGADYGILKAMTRVLGFNYTQITRHPFGFTGTEVEIETYGRGDPMNEIAKKAVEHKRALENQLFFGTRKFTSAAPSSKGYMGGLVEFITTNVSASIGTLSLTGLDSRLQDIFQYGSQNKVIFSAPTPARALSNLLSNNWVQAGPDETKYGAKVNSFVTGAYGGSVPVIVKRDWGRFPTTSNQYGGWMFVVDLDYVMKRPLRNRGTRLLRNRQGNGVDSVIHEYLTECSMEVSQEKVHGILKGITG